VEDWACGIAAALPPPDNQPPSLSLLLLNPLVIEPSLPTIFF